MVALYDALVSTLDDQRISRSEKKALRALLHDAGLAVHDRDVLVSRLFSEVERRMQHPGDRELLHALRDLVSLLRAPAEAALHPPTRVWFGPEEPMAETLCTLIAATTHSLDVAVFTITDDRVTERIVDAHRRGVAIRILSDDDKATDRGSDVVRIAGAGVPVRFDRSTAHFHHKFAVFDSRSVLNGSYNWTRGAATRNRENFLLTFEPDVVRAYREAFDRLWGELQES